MRSITLCAAFVGLVAGSALLAGCAPRLEAPRDREVCWHLVKDDAGKPKFNRLADHQPTLERCAVQLEVMRLQFRALGATQNESVGAYQGQFLFLQRTGVFTSETIDGYRYPFLIRTGDGRLAVPGAVQAQ